MILDERGSLRPLQGVHPPAGLVTRFSIAEDSIKGSVRSATRSHLARLKAGFKSTEACQDREKGEAQPSVRRGLGFNALVG